MNNLHLKIWLFLLVSLVTVASFAVTADSVFKDSSPGVVLIKDADSHGSGVVIDSDGIILTSYHVVNTPLPLQVTVDVFINGEKARVTFDKVQVLNVHKSYDLAKIKIELPEGVTLKPLKSASDLPETGEECFVIGNPGGLEGSALRNSISTGIIGASERLLENKKYIQTTASINPGNSGGALVDRRGRLAGIVSFIISDTEGIGFAIPVCDLKDDDFVADSERKGDLEKAKEYEKLGHDLLWRARSLRGESREMAYFLAVMACRFASMEDPSSPTPYYLMGSAYGFMENLDLAICCLRKALEMEGGKTPSVYHNLAMKEAFFGNVEEAYKLWRLCLLCKGDDSVRRDCAERYAESLKEKGRFFESAYLMRWSRNVGENSFKKELYVHITDNLSDAAFGFIDAKNENFSFEEMDAMAEKFAGKTMADAGKTMAGQTGDQQAEYSDQCLALIRSSLKDAAPLGTNGLAVAMPDAVNDLRPACGGLSLVMRFPEQKKLGVFNTAKCQFDLFIPLLSAESLFACGGQRLLVYDSSQNSVDVYSLPDGRKISSVKLTTEKRLTDINMGLLSSDKVIVQWLELDRKKDIEVYGVMDIPSMSIMPFRPHSQYVGQGFRSSGQEKTVFVRVDPSVSHFVSWGRSPKAYEFTWGIFDGLNVRSSRKGSSYETLSFISGSSSVISSKGMVLDTKGSVKHKFTEKGVSLFGIHGANMVIKVIDDKVTVVNLEDMGNLLSFKLPFDLRKSFNPTGLLTLDRTVFASSHLKRAVFLDNAGKQLVVFDLSNITSGGALELEKEVATAGSLWTYRLNYPGGTNITIEDYPEYMKLDGTNKMLSWQIPGKLKSGKYLVLLSIMEPEKEEYYERIWINVKGSDY